MVSADNFRSWAGGDEEVFAACRSELVKLDGRLADSLLVRVVERGDGARETFYLGNPDYARAAAIEDLDCKVSGGLCMTGVRTVDMEVRLGEARGAVGRAERYGKETGRLLEPDDFEPAQFQGAEEFHALFRGILRRHCTRELKDCLPWFSPRDRNSNNSEDAASDAAAPGDGTAAATELAAAELKEEMIAELARFSELLRSDGQDAAALTNDAIVAHLNGPEGWAEWDAGHFEFWAGVGADLRLSAAALAQRKKRFFGLLVKRRERVPEWLLLRALGLLAAEAESAVADCERASPLLGADLAAVLAAVRDFFLRSLAVQHPEHKQEGLAKLREAGAGALARGRGRVYVRDWPPDGAEFDAFCRNEGLLAGYRCSEVRRLLVALRNATPRPSRLIRTLSSVFPDAAAEEVT
jgi:hypothetical protein